MARTKKVITEIDPEILGNEIDMMIMKLQNDRKRLENQQPSPETGMINVTNYSTWKGIFSRGIKVNYFEGSDGG